MANVLVDEISLQNIADTIRKKGGTGKYKPFQMASAINSVYNNNIKQLWGVLQDAGQREDYSNLFSGFTDPIFIPKYNLKPTNATSMFESSDITDLTALLNNANVNLDLTKATTLYRMFFYSTITRCPRFILPKDSTLSLNCTFHSCRKLITIDGLFTTVNNKFTKAFYNCVSLKSIRFESGARIGNDISFAQSPLSKNSIVSVINALYVGGGRKTLTLKATAKTAAFTDSEWAALIATKPNWTISLV